MTPHKSPHASTEWNALPATIKTYLTAHAAGDDGTALGTFSAGAVVTDEGRDHIGRGQIEAWLKQSAGEYTYTTEFISATATGAATVDVVQHLEGDFPGGVADLHFRFSVDGALINRLVIEP